MLLNKVFITNKVNMLYQVCEPQLHRTYLSTNCESPIFITGISGGERDTRI